MKLDITAKNASVGEKLTQTLEKKLAKLDKYFSHEPEARVVIKGEKSRQVLEVSIAFKGTFLRAEESDKTAYACIDKVLPKLEKQIVRNRHKFGNDRQKINDALMSYEFLKASEISEELPEIVKTKKFEVQPIDLKEAVAALELVDHDFYLFLNTESNSVEAVYRREDGKIGHLIPVVK